MITGKVFKRKEAAVEYILAAATHFDDGKVNVHQPTNIKTGVVLCGWRHGSIFAQTGLLVMERRNLGVLNETQGFLTNKNRFVGREEAGDIAFKAGQISEPNDYLYSEDLY
jgi:hypothetical protein